MALLIVRKELSKLKKVAKEKGIKLSFNQKCIEYIVTKGISAEYGAREISRLIESKIKPLLAQEILFGSLNEGGSCKISLVEEEFKIKVN